MPAPKGWERNTQMEDKTRSLEYYWNVPDDPAGTYVSITNRDGKYYIASAFNGMSISRQVFSNPYDNKERARKEAVNFIKYNDDRM